MNISVTMKRSIILWVLAFLITAASAVYQRMTGPTYPVKGSLTIGPAQVLYHFKRSHDYADSTTVEIVTSDPSISGWIEWKRYKTTDDWSIEPLQLANGTLTADLPHQPPAGKLMYRVVLVGGEKQTILPADGPVVMRFKGNVPLFVLILHVFVMFSAMLVSTRGGLEYFSKVPKLGTYILASLVLLFVGGLILGPVVQKYAFDAYWTGWPFGSDLTDNKTAAAFVFWCIAWYMNRKSKNPAMWALIAAIATLLVFMIPHSVLGSEFDYSQGN